MEDKPENTSSEQEKMEALIAELAKQEQEQKKIQSSEAVSKQNSWSQSPLDQSEQEKMDALIAELAKQEGLAEEQKTNKAEKPQEEDSTDKPEREGLTTEPENQNPQPAEDDDRQESMGQDQIDALLKGLSEQEEDNTEKPQEENIPETPDREGLTIEPENQDPQPAEDDGRQESMGQDQIDSLLKGISEPDANQRQEENLEVPVAETDEQEDSPPENDQLSAVLSDISRQINNRGTGSKHDTTPETTETNENDDQEKQVPNEQTKKDSPIDEPEKSESLENEIGSEENLQDETPANEEDQLEAVLADISSQVSIRETKVKDKISLKSLKKHSDSESETRDIEQETNDTESAEDENHEPVLTREDQPEENSNSHEKSRLKRRLLWKVSLAACLAFVVLGSYVAFKKTQQASAPAETSMIVSERIGSQLTRAKNQPVKPTGPALHPAGPKAELRSKDNTAAETTIHQNSKASKLKKKMEGIVFLKEEISEIIRISEEKRYEIQEQINHLSEEILIEQERLVLKTFKIAEQSSRISHNLNLIIQLLGYDAGFYEKITDFKVCEEKLNYFYQQAQDDLRIIETLNDLEVEQLIAEVDAVINKYLPQTTGPIISADSKLRYDPEKVWHDIIHKTRASGEMAAAIILQKKNL